MPQQSCTERDVSTLLRRAGNPRALAAAPLMGAVCRATGKCDPVDALRYVVRMALAGGDRRTAELRDAIFEADFENAATNAQLAQRSGVSRRHFQRWRSRAVRTIARYTQEMLGPRDAQSDPTAPSRVTASRSRDNRLEGDWRFERERAEFFRARDAGATREMHSISASLMRLAGGRDARACAALWRAEASVHLGRAEEAAARLDDLALGERLYVQAKLALLKGAASGAEAYACSALPRLAGRERVRCDALISQLRLMRSAPWRPSEGVAEFAPQSWERTATEIEEAQHHGRRDEWSRAESAALTALSHAQRRGFFGLSARSAGLLAACAGARGDTQESLDWRTLAIGRLLATHDCVLAAGLLPRSARMLPVNGMLKEVLYSRLCLIVPQMLGDAGSRTHAVRELLAALVERATSAHHSVDLAKPIAAVARNDSAFVHYLDARFDDAAEMLALATAALGDVSWQLALQRARDALATVALGVRPLRRRTIAISTAPHIVRSQSELTEHLRVDDRRPAGSSTEDVANIRLRLVSLRAGTRGALPWRGRDSAVGAALGVADVTSAR